MSTTVVLVAQNAHARILENRGPGTGLIELRELHHPESSSSDRYGVVKDGQGPQTRNLVHEQTPKEREAENFAREVVSNLRELRLSNRFDQAMIVAAPAFLGLLRKIMDESDRRFVEAELDKNVATHDLRAIEAQVGKLLPV